VTNCHQLKLRAADGKMRLTDVADTEQVLRLIQSIPSKKAESFKPWLAKVGSEFIGDMTKLYFVRHGESEYGASQLVAGWSNPPLTELGKKQAHDTGKALRSNNIDLIFSSDLERAYQTALIIREEVNEKLPLLVDWLLREKSFGEKEKAPWDMVDWSKVDKDELDYHSDNSIEHPDNFMSRITAFLKNLNLLPDSFHNIVVTTSGGVMVKIEQIYNPDNFNFNLDTDFANGQVKEYDLNELLKRLEVEK
jgi:broad specificity phosphatase PhoE